MLEIAVGKRENNKNTTGPVTITVTEPVSGREGVLPLKHTTACNRCFARALLIRV